ncbi:MAG TPA: precorrin-8X methylmutase [Dissulfurispiraceae bacterium]|nr:precorrin-8X methylmutase [Dissulfurispiraceae bacterium]
MTTFNTAEKKSERIIIIGHGSPRKEANTIGALADSIHAELHPGCGNNCVRGAYLQFSTPDIETVIAESVSEGAARVILHPFFLNSGMHVTKDIPDLISEARLKYPGVEFIYTEPLGMHEKLIEIVKERISASRGYAPPEIERRSFEIIGEEFDLSAFPSEQLPIIKRVIHATADFELGLSLNFHPDAVRVGIEAIRSGRDILTDVEMARTGINKHLLAKWGGKVICGLTDIASHDEASMHGRCAATRSEKGIEQAFKGNNNIGVIVVGNAPTALLKVIHLLTSTDDDQKEKNQPHERHCALVVGVPVGFVKAFESKALLSAQDFPFITNLSRKGGSTVAVAIVNALLRMAEER